MVERQARTFEAAMPKGMRIQVPPRAPNLATLRNFFASGSCLKGIERNRLTIAWLRAKNFGGLTAFADAIPYSMPRQQKKRTAPPAKKEASTDDNGSTICALCGRIIKP